MVSVDFNELPELTKNRFIASTRPGGGRLAYIPSSSSSLASGCFLFVIGLALIGALMVSLASARQNDEAGWKAVGFLGFLAFLAVLAGLSIAAARRVAAGYPYSLGTH